MSIFQKIKESITRPFKKNKSKNDALLPFLYGLDMSEKKDFTYQGIYFQDEVSQMEVASSVKKFNEVGMGKKVCKHSENRRVKKANHIYNSTKNKRIKRKQLKIIKKEGVNS